jgi:hypothetical protein
VITVTYWFEGRILAHHLADRGAPAAVGTTFMYRLIDGSRERLIVRDVEVSNNPTDSAVDLEIDVRLGEHTVIELALHGQDGLLVLPRCALCGGVIPQADQADQGCAICNPEPEPEAKDEAGDD